MRSGENALETKNRTVVSERRLLACAKCGWVHYVMTAEEKALNDQTLSRLIQKYQLTETEQHLYESAYKQCLRCETPAYEFRAAGKNDLDRAAGHIVTPVFVSPEIGTN